MCRIRYNAHTCEDHVQGVVEMCCDVVRLMKATGDESLCSKLPPQLGDSLRNGHTQRLLLDADAADVAAEDEVRCTHTDALLARARWRSLRASGEC